MAQKKKKKSLACRLGFHKMEKVGYSSYRTNAGAHSGCYREFNAPVYKCSCCGASKTPEWYSAKWRKIHPLCDIHGFTTSREWYAEFPELVKA
jgi:hypothetical protein